MMAAALLANQIAANKVVLLAFVRRFGQRHQIDRRSGDVE